MEEKNIMDLLKLTPEEIEELKAELKQEEFLLVYDKPRPIPIHNYHPEEIHVFPPKSGQEKRRENRKKKAKKKLKNKKL